MRTYRPWKWKLKFQMRIYLFLSSLMKKWKKCMYKVLKNNNNTHKKLHDHFWSILNEILKKYSGWFETSLGYFCLVSHTDIAQVKKKKKNVLHCNRWGISTAHVKLRQTGPLTRDSMIEKLVKNILLKQNLLHFNYTNKMMIITLNIIQLTKWK